MAAMRGRDIRGFGVVDISLLCVAVVLLAVIGYRFLSPYFQNGGSASRSTSTPAVIKRSPAPSVPAAPNPPALTSTVGGMYKDKETGLVFSYPSSYLATPYNKGIMLATSQAEKDYDASCSKAGVCHFAELLVEVGSFAKNAGESYGATLMRNKYPSDWFYSVASIGGSPAYQASWSGTSSYDYKKTERNTMYVIDTPERVVWVKGMSTERDISSELAQLLSTAKLQ